MSDKRQLMRLIVDDYELFRVFLDRLGETHEDPPVPGLFQFAGVEATEDDRRIVRGVRYVEFLIENYVTGGDDLQLQVAIDLMLKRGYDMQHLDPTWVAEVKVICYASITYMNAGGSWVSPIATTSIADIGPYHILRGLLIAIAAAVAS